MSLFALSNPRRLATLLLGSLTLLSLPAYAEDPAVQVIRGRRYVQASTAAPSVAPGSSAAFFRAEAVGLGVFEPISGAQVTPPGGASIALARATDGTLFVERGFATAEARDAAFPDGRYNFSATLNLLGATRAHTTASALTAPPAPHVSNFADTQVINADEEFTLNWDSFSGAGTDDTIRLQVSDPATGEIIEDDQNLSPDTQSWVFSAGGLPAKKTLQVRLTFNRGAPPGTPDADELLSGRFIVSSETTLQILTSGTSTGPVDTTPPQLISTLPAFGDTLSSPLSAVAFTFNEAMNPAGVAIGWNATINGTAVALDVSKFQTVWSDDHLTLAVLYNTSGGGWPAGATVSWTLNPQPGAAGNFRDAAGNELATRIGGFLSAGGIDPCSAPANPGQDASSAFFFAKQVSYLQIDAGDPAADPEQGAVAFAFIDLPGNASTSITDLKVPTANPFAFKIKAMSSLQGAPDLSRRFFSEKFASRAELDDAYPAGTYAMEVRSGTATTTNSASLTVTATGYPPVPHFSNFAGTQAFEATRDGTLGWDSFAGATTNAEFITLNLYAPNGTLVFRAPDPCHDRKLAPDAAGIVVPAHTLTNGVTYTAELAFSRFTDHGKLLAGIAGSGSASLTRITRLALKTGTGASPAGPIMLTPLAGGAPGSLQLQVACNAGQSLVVESSSGVTGAFQSLFSTNAPSAQFVITVPSPGNAGFIRLRTP